MEERGLVYLSGLGDLLSQVQVADGTGPLPLEGGIERAIALILSRTTLGNKVLFIGNGGSAAIASHQAVDYWKNGGMRALAFNDPSLLTCISNDFGYPYVFEKPLEMFAEPWDVLVAISSSGRSPNILGGVLAARRRGCRVITLSGFAPDNPLRSDGDLNFYVPSHSYGYVEICHLALCHCILDCIIQGKRAAPKDSLAVA